MTFDDFADAVQAAVDALPPNVVAALDNVAIVPEEGQADGPLGEYFGVPRVDRWGDISGLLPDKIAIYYLAIQEECSGNAAAMHEEIRRTLWHEIGHHLGWDDDVLEHAEIARGWRQSEPNAARMPHEEPHGATPPHCTH